ncbi:MAG: hypothetical protein ACYS9C_01875, partial [Planctomycetota bacterium]
MKNLLQLIQRTIFLVPICSTICIAQQIPDGPYLGQAPPGPIAQVFAPGLICNAGKRPWEAWGTFSADGN